MSVDELSATEIVEGAVTVAGLEVSAEALAERAGFSWRTVESELGECYVAVLRVAQQKIVLTTFPDDPQITVAANPRVSGPVLDDVLRALRVRPAELAGRHDPEPWQDFALPDQSPAERASDASGVASLGSHDLASSVGDVPIYAAIGQLYLIADEHPEVGPRLKAADLVIQYVFNDPEAFMVVGLRAPGITVKPDFRADDPDVTMFWSAAVADKYFRGEYNLAVGLARGQVKAKGPINKVLKIVPLLKPLHSIYRELVDSWDTSDVLY